MRDGGVHVPCVCACIGYIIIYIHRHTHVDTYNMSICTHACPHYRDTQTASSLNVVLITEGTLN